MGRTFDSILSGTGSAAAGCVSPRSAAGLRTARMPLMGVRRQYRGTARGAALALGVIEAVRSWHAAHGAQAAELSWVLEDNRATHDIIQMVGGRPYKTYRVYEKALA